MYIMVILEIGGCFMKNFLFDTICNITQESQELYTKIQLCLWVLGKSAVMKYHQMYQRLIFNGKSHINQLVTASFTTSSLINSIIHPDSDDMYYTGIMQQLLHYFLRLLINTVTTLE